METKFEIAERSQTNLFLISLNRSTWRKISRGKTFIFIFNRIDQLQINKEEKEQLQTEKKKLTQHTLFLTRLYTKYTRVKQIKCILSFCHFILSISTLMIRFHCVEKLQLLKTKKSNIFPFPPGLNRKAIRRATRSKQQRILNDDFHRKSSSLASIRTTYRKRLKEKQKNSSSIRQENEFTEIFSRFNTTIVRFAR